jgi:hypothetical protein
MEPAHGNAAQHDTGKRSSNRAFGIVFAVVFLIGAVFPLFSGGTLRAWALAAAAAFVAVAAFAPALLTYPNRLWLAFGALLHRVVSPVALGLIYFAAIVPTGLLMRLTGKDFLSLRRRVGESSYWVERRPPGPPPDSLKNQF